MRLRTNKKQFDYAAIVFCVLIILCYLKWTQVEEKTEIVMPENVPTRSTNFEDIYSAQIEPNDGKNVFFTETGESTRATFLNARQACAVESAAIAYSDSTIYLLYSSQERLKSLHTSTPIFEVVMSYSNVRINHLNLTTLAAGSPFEEFLRSDKLQQSKHREVHTSDTLKWLLLWKFGGTYFDLDTIIRKQFDPFLFNFACKQNSHEVTSVVLNFESRQQGKYLLDYFVKMFIGKFNGDIHEIAGPVLTTQTVKNLCNVANIEDIKTTDCEEFHVLETDECIPIPWQDWRLLINEDTTSADDVMKKINEAFTVHLWGPFSNGETVKIDSNAPYAQLAREFCPKVAKAIIGNF